MSFRPTITVYANGKIADIGYYRNWDETSLFYEAIAIAAVFNNCESVEEYRRKKFKAQTIKFLLDPEEIENTQENLKMLEECSEYPILIDLTARYIYKNVGCLLLEELDEIPSVDIEKEINGSKINYEVILDKYKIPLDAVDCDKVKSILGGSPELQACLSRDTLHLLRAEIGQN